MHPANYTNIAAQLAEEARISRLCVFVGAGVSASVGYPLWGKLIEDMVDEQGIKTQENDLTRLAARLESDMGALPFRERLAAKLRGAESDDSELSTAIINLPTSLFLTTNFDHLLEDRMRILGQDPHVIVKHTDLPSINPNRKTIVKLHGDIDSPASMVITSKDYSGLMSERRQDNNVFDHFFESQLSQKTILFVGVSFKDPRLRAANERIVDMFGRFRRPAIITLLKPSDPDAMEDFEYQCKELEETGLTPLVFEGEEQIVKFLQQVNQELAKKAKVKTADSSSPDDRIEFLEEKLKGQIDQKLEALIEEVQGSDKSPRPAPSKAAKKADELLQFVSDQPELDIKTKCKAWLVAGRAYVVTDDRREDAKKRLNEVLKFEKDFTEEISEQVARLKAKILFYEGNQEEALSVLDNYSRPGAIAVRLSILLELGRNDEILEYVENLGEELHPQWGYYVIMAMVALGKMNEAKKKFLEHARELSGNDLERLKVAYADSTYVYVITQSNIAGKVKLGLLDLSEENKKRIENVIELTQKVVEDSKKPPEEDVNVWAATVILLRAYILMNNLDKAMIHASKLLNINPVIKDVAQVYGLYAEAIQGDIPGEKIKEYKNLKNRLIKQYPKELWANITVSLIEEHESKDLSAAYQRLKRLKELSGPDSLRRFAAMKLHNLGLALGREDEARAIIEDALPENDPLLKVQRARELMIDEELLEAKKLLESTLAELTADDLSAEVYISLGDIAVKTEDWERAREHYRNAARIHPDKEIFEKLLHVYSRLEDNQMIIETADKIASITEPEKDVLLVQARAYWNLAQIEKAREIYSELHKEEPDNPVYANELAHTLFQLKDYRGALTTVDSFVQDNDQFDDDCLRVYINALSALSEHAAIYSKMKSLWRRIKEIPVAVAYYMNVCYQTGKEDDAHKAFRQLTKLKADGKVDDRLFRPISIEQFKELVLEWRKKEKEILTSYETCSVPLELYIANENISQYMDWAIRTQPLQGEIYREYHARFQVYATNHFSLRPFPAGGQEPISPWGFPKDSKKILIAYDALITLDQLGLLEKIGEGDFFEKVYYLSGYEHYWRMFERDKLIAHQKTEEMAARAIKRDLERPDDKRILVEEIDDREVPEGVEPQAVNAFKILALARQNRFPLIDSFNDFSSLDTRDIEIIGIRSLAEWQYGNAKLSERELGRVRSLSENRELIEMDQLTDILDRSSGLAVTEKTLGMMYKHKMVEPLLKEFDKIVMLKEEADKVRWEVSAYDLQDKIQKRQKALTTEKIKNLLHFEAIDLGAEHLNEEWARLLNSDDTHELMAIVLKTYRLAEVENLPLLTDDRYKSVMLDNVKEGQSFSTDILLEKLAAENRISTEEYKDHFLQLCRWRYRFLIPPLKILVYLAEQNAGSRNPVNEELRFIARYAKDCMRDPGLPPVLLEQEKNMTVAALYYLRWVDRLIEFLGQVWHMEDTFSEEAARKITDWVWMYRPPLPDVLSQEKRAEIAEREEFNLTQKLFIQVLLANNEQSRVSGLVEATFHHLYSGKWDEKLIEAIEAFRVKVEPLFHDKEISKFQAHKFMLKTILPALDGLEDKSDLVRDYMLEKGMIDFQERELDSREKDALQKRADALRDVQEKQRETGIEKQEGPVRAYRVKIDDKEWGHLEIPHKQIKFPDPRVREGVLDSIVPPGGSGSPQFVTDFTRSRIEKLRLEIRSQDKKTWVPAAEEAARLMLKDYRYTFAAAVQLLSDKIKIAPKEQNELINELLRAQTKIDLNTLREELPEPLKQEKWSAGSVKKQLTREVETTLDGKDAASTDLIRSLIEKGGLPLLNRDFSIEGLIVEYLKANVKGQVNSSAAEKITSQIWDEIEKTEDALVLRCGVQAMLALRPYIKSDKSLFDKDFKSSVQGLLTGFNSRPDDGRYICLAEGWKLVQVMAMYFMMYLDLESQEVFPEPERRVAISWWMAWRFRKIIDNAMPGTEREQRLRAFKGWQEPGQNLVERTALRWMFSPKIPGIARKQTFDPSDYEISMNLVSSLAGETAKGLSEPVRLLEVEWRDLIINVSVLDAGLAGGFLGGQRAEELPWLWYDPPCQAGPDFLRNYYTGSSFAFLGQERVEKIEAVEELESLIGQERTEMVEVAESLGSGKFPDDKMFKPWGKAAKAMRLKFHCSIVHQLANSGNKLPQEFKDKYGKGKLAKEVNDLLPEMFIKSVSLLAGAIVDLCRSSFAEDVDWLSARMQGIDYSKIPEEPDAGEAAGYLVYAVLLGAPIELLKNNMRAWKKNREIRDTMQTLERVINKEYGYIPAEKRERAREVANLLAEV